MFYSCLSGLPQTTEIQTQIIQLMKACHEAFPRKGYPPLIVALCLATPNCTFSAIMRHGPRGLCAGTAEARSSTSTASSWDGKRPGTGNPSKGTSQRLCFGGPESFLGRTDATAPKPGRRIISDKEPMGPPVYCDRLPYSGSVFLILFRSLSSVQNRKSSITLWTNGGAPRHRGICFQRLSRQRGVLVDNIK